MPVAGFQAPLAIRQRREKIEEMLEAHPDIDRRMVISFISGMDDAAGEECGARLDRDPSAVADEIRRHVVREFVRQRMREVVRKKPDGSGFVLYSPNPKKKGRSKPVGTFPTRAMAKRAELSRFPPRDPNRLRRLRRDVERMRKNPRAAGKREAFAPEMILRGRLSEALVASARSRLLERSGTAPEAGWDELVSRLSPDALRGKLGRAQREIEKVTGSVLEDAAAVVRAALRGLAKVKSAPAAEVPSRGEVAVAFQAIMDGVTVGPMWIALRDGVPHIDISPEAKAALGKCDPKRAKEFRAELITAQERRLDDMDDVKRARAARDKLLQKMEDDVDGYVASLEPAQLIVLKRLLAMKYRKLT